MESNSIYAQNLKGIAIGNGWVDPYVQYQAYGQFALKNKLISQTEATIAKDMYIGCKGMKPIFTSVLAYRVVLMSNQLYDYNYIPFTTSKGVSKLH